MRKQFTTTIEEDIQSDFKAACKNNNNAMNDVLEAFMKSYIDGKFDIEKKTTYELKAK